MQHYNSASVKLVQIVLSLVLLVSGLSYALALARLPPTLPKYYLASTCQPCKLAIAPTLPTISVSYEVVNQPDGTRTVKALKLVSEDKPGWSQTLPIKEMQAVQAEDELLVGITDLNFDGNNDLYFVTSSGVANEYADYWVFDPAKTMFIYLGNYPILRVDAAKKSISSYERGGHGGMIYESKKYRFINNALIPIEVEKQQPTKQYGVYTKSTSQLKDGKLQLLKEEEVKAAPQK